MKTKSKLLTLLILSASTAAATAVINKFVKLSASSKISYQMQSPYVTNGDSVISIIRNLVQGNHFF